MILLFFGGFELFLLLFILKLNCFLEFFIGIFNVGILNRKKNNNIEFVNFIIKRINSSVLF